MEWAEYKQLCDQPNFMSRNLIEVTAALARACNMPALSQSLLDACEGEGAFPLERPVDHQGDDRTHMFRVKYSAQQVREVLVVLESAELRSAGALPVRRLAGFRAAWLEYEEWLKKQ